MKKLIIFLVTMQTQTPLLGYHCGVRFKDVNEQLKYNQLGISRYVSEQMCVDNRVLLFVYV